jgi:hypothetical protein
LDCGGKLSATPLLRPKPCSILDESAVVASLCRRTPKKHRTIPEMFSLRCSGGRVGRIFRSPFFRHSAFGVWRLAFSSAAVGPLAIMSRSMNLDSSFVLRHSFVIRHPSFVIFSPYSLFACSPKPPVRHRTASPASDRQFGIGSRNTDDEPTT